MAEATEMPVDMNSLKEQTTCTSCQQQYTNPKTLPCLHSYCLQCLERASSKEGSSTQIWCPECRKRVSLGDAKLDELTDAFYIVRQVQLYTFLQKVTGRAEVKCEKCSTKQARAGSFCNDCGKFVCDLCVQIHRSWSEYQKHKVVTLGELRESFKESIPPFPSDTLSCKLHSKLCTVFCETCEEQICHECIIKLHRDHQYNLVDESAKKHKAYMKEKLDTIQGLPPLLQQSIATLEGLSRGLTNKATAVTAAVNAKFDQVERLLAERRKALLQDLSVTVEGKVKLLQQQKEGLVSCKKGVMSCTDFVGRTNQEPHDSEFFLLEHTMAERIVALKKEFGQLELIPAEEPDIYFAFNQDICDAAKATGAICDGSLLQAGLDGQQVFMTNELVTFYLSLSPAYYKIRDNPMDQLKADIQSLRDGSVCAATVAVSSSGFAKLQCSFSERGRYYINVRISGHHISGSPYQFYIKPPTSQFHQSIRIINKLSSPRGVAVNGTNQMIVTEESSHTVTVYGKKGKAVLKTGTMGSSDGAFNSPMGVTCDANGFIYVADSKNNRVVKLSAEGIFAGAFDGAKSSCGRMNGPTGVKIAPDGRLFVVDRGNGRVIALTPKMEFDPSFGPSGLCNAQLQDPWDVAFDKQGFVYVTDTRQNSVQIFSEAGDYRGKIGSQGNQKSRLSRPSGIAIDRFGRMYVSEMGNNRVSIFHVFSEFLDCFTAPGSSMACPCGIAVDEDGYVYVCSNEAVHVF